MARLSRTLTSVTTADPPEAAVNVESDFVVILAALLCALICVVGLIAVARCAWLRRSGSTDDSRSRTRSKAANKGLKKKVLQSLPKFTYATTVASDGDVVGCPKFASTECAICLGEFNEGDEIRMLPQCGHGFHIGCIDTWLGNHSSCPSCRQILVVAARCRNCGHFPDASNSSSSFSSSAATTNINACHEVESKGREDDNSNSNSNSNSRNHNSTNHVHAVSFLP